MSGVGGGPAGAMSAGLGTITTSAAPGLAVLPDVVTSLPQSGRFIDPTTKDYRLASDGRYLGTATTNQMVLLALTTAFGSSVDPTLGQSFGDVKEKGPNFISQMTAKVNSALADLVKRKFIIINAVKCFEWASNPDLTILQVYWTDVATGTAQTNSIIQ